jgi:Tfp pilus assembly protein PilF
MPDEAEAVLGLGLVALEQDRVGDAEQSFKRAIAIADVQARAARRRPTSTRTSPAISAPGRRLPAQRGSREGARRLHQRSVDLWPAHGESWHKLARVLQRLGDTAGAEQAHGTIERGARAPAAEGKRLRERASRENGPSRRASRSRSRVRVRVPGAMISERDQGRLRRAARSTSST